jgi:GT2 family glycosyltransferase
MDFPLVTILIITWNRKKDVLETVQSVYEQAYKNFEIIVVDNGSNDGTVDALSHDYPNVRIVALDRNMGASVGRNKGIAVALGEIVFCLDSDASLDRDALNNLIRKFQAEPGIGVINCKIVNAYTKILDEGPGWVYSSKQKAQQHNEFLSFSFSEGGAAIRKEVFDKVGMFWDFLFFGCEGQEIALRVLNAGYKIIYFPESLVYHRASEQQKVSNKNKDYLYFINTLYIYIVRYPWWLLAVMGPLKIGAVTVRFAKQGYLRAMFDALREITRKLPALLKERKPITNQTAWFYLKLMRQQGPLSWDLSSWLKYKT